MQDKTKPKRKYKRITPREIVEFQALAAEHGSGSEAVRQYYPEVLDPAVRAHRVLKKSKEQDTAAFIDEQFQRIGVDAINRLGQLVNSSDSRIATKNVHYAIDHIRGQATKKSITLHGQANIQDVLA